MVQFEILAWTLAEQVVKKPVLRVVTEVQALKQAAHQYPFVIPPAVIVVVLHV